MLTDSPEFAAPQLAGPYLKALSPNTYDLQVQNPRQALTLQSLKFEIASEDLNRRTDLDGAVVVDFPGFGRSYPDQLDHVVSRLSIPAGHLDTPRQVETEKFALGARWPLGCHSVTLIVAPQFDRTSTIIRPAIDPDAPRFDLFAADAGAGDVPGGKLLPVATLTWWYLLVPEMGPAVDLGGCYARQVEAADAGGGSQGTIEP